MLFVSNTAGSELFMVVKINTKLIDFLNDLPVSHYLWTEITWFFGGKFKIYMTFCNKFIISQLFTLLFTKLVNKSHYFYSG